MNRFTADIIVIGGGIVGSSIALRLAEKGQDVILLEKGRVGEEESARNAGVVRQQNRDPAELPLAMDASKIWADMEGELDSNIGYRRGGHIILAASEERFETLRRIAEQETMMGLCVEMLSAEEVRYLTPTISENLEIFGAKYSSSDGTANPLLATKAVARASRRRGVSIREYKPVLRLKAERGRITAALTENEEYHGAVFVNAAGAWARGLCNTVGLDIPIVIQKARLLITEALPPMVEQVVVMDESYYRQTLEGNVLTIARARYTVDNFDRSVDFRDFVDVGRLLPVFLSFLKNFNVIRSFAGIAHSTPDQIPILDKAPGYDNLFLAAGFSAHGFCIGPIVGKLIAEWIVNGKSSLDLSAFRAHRFDYMDISKEFNFRGSSLTNI
jgi:sarcosine oxidase subunit beta